MKHLLWKLFPKRWRHANSGYQRLRRSPEKLRGILNTVPLSSRIGLLSLYSFLTPAGRVGFRTHHVPSPLTLRYGTSDREVYEQVFVEKQYELDALEDPQYIIDAGANIGLAAAYLLAKYPQARLVAIEPDPENLEIARLNLEPFGSRCQLVHGAIWSSRRSLTLQKSELGHWATQVSSEFGGGVQVQGYTIDQIKTEFEFPRIDLLKVDIEGAELPLFRDGNTDFLRQTRCCAVECHSAESQRAFEAACNSSRFQISAQGELSIATQVSK